jgi:hypothetical protein
LDEERARPVHPATPAPDQLQVVVEGDGEDPRPRDIAAQVEQGEGKAALVGRGGLVAAVARAAVKAMAADGVVVVACQACADSFGVTPQLGALGIDVKYMGKPLTDMLKGGWKVLTF